MAQIIHLITSYLNTQKNHLDTKPYIISNDKYTSISFVYRGTDIELTIYNDTFIKMKVNQIPYAICDSIKTFRLEIDRLHATAYQ